MYTDWVFRTAIVTVYPPFKVTCMCVCVYKEFHCVLSSRHVWNSIGVCLCCAVTHQVLFLQTTGLRVRVLGLQLLVGPTQVLNGDLCIAHPDQLQHRIVNEYVLTLERE